MTPAAVILLVTLAVAAGAALAIAWVRRAAAAQAELAAARAIADAEARAAAATAAAEAQTAVLAEQAAAQAEAIQRAMHTAMASLQIQAGHERDAAVQAALAQVAVMGREQLSAESAAVSAELAATTTAVSAELTAKKDVIESRLGQMQSEVRSDIDRLTTLVNQLGEATSERFGQVDSSLRAHAEVTQHLTSTTQSLREALASPNNRGQWGERMAEDIIRAAGFIEHKQYRKRTAVSGSGQGIPDFTFMMPKGQVLFMDVKFPMAAYLRFLDATTEAEKATHRATFLRDVRMRVKELARREYAASDDRPAVDNVLLFVPNETLSAFIHETDPALIDDAMRQNVVICSPLTLFAFLGIIRQAFDNFVMEQTSQEMLQLLGKFAQQWGKYTESIDKVKRQFDTVSRSFDELATTRRRALERPLKDLEALRLDRNVAVDGELFAAEVLEMEGYRELGA
jgi:DNA recombination protein RmuC